MGPVHLNWSSCFEVPKDGRWDPRPGSSPASWAQTILQRRATDILTDKTAAPASMLPAIPEYGILDRYRQKTVHASLRHVVGQLISFQLDARLCTSPHTRAPTGFRTDSALDLPCKQNGHWRGRPNPVIDPSHFERHRSQARQVRRCTKNLLRPVLSDEVLVCVGCGLLCTSFLTLCPHKHLESRRDCRGWSLTSAPAGLAELFHALAA